MLTETLADAEVDIKSLKSIVEKKDDELSQSEEQCRHLGLFHLQDVYLIIIFKIQSCIQSDLALLNILIVNNLALATLI